MTDERSTEECRGCGDSGRYFRDRVDGFCSDSCRDALRDFERDEKVGALHDEIRDLRRRLDRASTLLAQRWNDRELLEDARRHSASLFDLVKRQEWRISVLERALREKGLDLARDPLE